MAAPSAAPSSTKEAPSPARASTVDPAEVARFAALAQTWWDPEGEMKPLHRLNPVRLAFIRDRLARHFGRDPLGRDAGGRAAGAPPFAGLRLLDIGCGGGLVAEPMARLGFAVTAIDAAERNLGVARAHAAAGGLAIDYRAAAAEDLAEAGLRFDAVLALEVVEHVADPKLFLAAAAALVRPGGVLVASTLNRTAQAYLLAILGAEYVLRWLPRGTHHWRRFLRPSELAAGLRPHGLHLAEVAGLTYRPLSGDWALSQDYSVNYLMLATKPRVS